MPDAEPDRPLSAPGTEPGPTGDGPQDHPGPTGHPDQPGHVGHSEPTGRPDQEDLGAIEVDPIEEYARVEDSYERLWTPHRMVYINGEGKPKDSQAGDQCPFCRAPDRSDEDALIVHRGRAAYVLLNLFPYNTGHVLVCPYRHVADYTELTEDETIEIAQLTQRTMTVIRSAMGPDGFNLGMNQGDVAGAGIAAHMHQHVVPRWLGDANFLPIIGRTKALPTLLADTRRQLADAWDA